MNPKSGLLAMLISATALAGVQESEWQLEQLEGGTRLSIYADVTWGNQMSIYVPRGHCAGQLDFWFATYNAGVLPPYEGQKIPVRFAAVHPSWTDEFNASPRLAAVLEDPFDLGNTEHMNIAILTVGEIQDVFEFARIVEERQWTGFQATAPDDALFDVPHESWSTDGLSTVLRQVPGCQGRTTLDSIPRIGHATQREVAHNS